MAGTAFDNIRSVGRALQRNPEMSADEYLETAAGYGVAGTNEIQNTYKALKEKEMQPKRLAFAQAADTLDYEPLKRRATAEGVSHRHAFGWIAVSRPCPYRWRGDVYRFNEADGFLPADRSEISVCPAGRKKQMAESL